MLLCIVQLDVEVFVIVLTVRNRLNSTSKKAVVSLTRCYYTSYSKAEIYFRRSN